MLPGPAVEITVGGSPNAALTAHACARLANGDVFCWGSNQQGQLGTGGAQSSPIPAFVPQIGGALHVSAGSSHTCAIDGGNQLFCWGNNSMGQLGNGNVGGSQPQPITVKLP